MTTYKTGTVTVTNGSATVTGSGTAWAAAVETTDLFALDGVDVAKSIESVDSDTQITLSTAWAGATAAGATYQITRDFEPTANLPLIQRGDVSPWAIFNEAILRLVAWVSTVISGYVETVNGNSPDGSGDVTLSFGVSDISGAVASVNGNSPDGSGDVTLSFGVSDISGAVASVNGVDPDGSGDVSLNINANKIRNGGFLINQRAVSGTVVLAAGAYGHDMCKAGASGCTYTFSTSGGKTTINISAGTLRMPIMGADIITGTYIATWGGTAAGHFLGFTYGASGIMQALTAGTTTYVEFATGTVEQVQVRQGTVAVPWVQPDNTDEMRRCMDYLQIFGGNSLNERFATSGYCGSTTAVFPDVQLKQKMAASPSLTYSNLSNMSLVGAGGVFTPTALSVAAAGDNIVTLSVTVASGLTAQTLYMFAANSSLSPRLIFSAEP